MVNYLNVATILHAPFQFLLLEQLIYFNLVQLCFSITEKYINDSELIHFLLASTEFAYSQQKSEIMV